MNYRGIRTGQDELITKQKIPMPQLSTATATGILSKQKTTIGRLRFGDGFNIQSHHTSIFPTAQILC